MDETSDERRRRLAREKQARYAAKYPDRVAASRKKSYAKHGDKRRSEARESGKTRAWTPERNDTQNEWRRNNRESVRAYNRAYKARRRLEDLDFRLTELLRGRVSRAVKNGSAVRDLGCTVQELRGHLEKQFQEGMTWDNHGREGWHIDHRKPLASFDLTDPAQFKKACHFTNLQPLWAKDNLSKGAKVVD